MSELHFCNDHATIHFNSERSWYEANNRTGSGPRSRENNGIRIDIDGLFCDETIQPPWGWHAIQLIETGGNAILRFDVGVESCAALASALQRRQTPRPTTHQALATTISTLGGTVIGVKVTGKDMEPGVYAALVQIVRDGEVKHVDMRTSDALVLAVICEAPVYATEDCFSPS